MGRIVSNFFISLDGVVQDPHEWHFPYFDDDMGEIVGQGMETCEAFMMGRTLYDEWSHYWPNADKDEPFAQFINNVQKYVVSSTLKDAEVTWTNTTLVDGDVESRIREIKEATARDIGISGSATLVRSLLAMGLLDELALLVHPIAVGRGTRLFEGTPTYPLELTSQRTLSTGVLHLTYAPATT